MRSRKKHTWIEPMTAIAAVVIFYGLLQLAGITCPIKWLTGISCAGCGMTRAWIALLHFDMVRAYYFHPLFWVPPLVVLLILIREKIPEKVFAGLMWLFAILFVVVYLYRMMAIETPVVVFEPENGIIFKRIRSIFTF